MSLNPFDIKSKITISKRTGVYLEIVIADRYRPALFLEIQFLYDRRIAARIILLEVDEMRLAVSDHAEQTTARVVVFLVLLEVVAQLDDALCQKRHLHF